VEQAIAFGALSKYLFSIGQTYQWIVLALPVGFAVPLNILLPPSVFPYSRFWLLRYTSHLLLPGLPLGGYQLFRDDVLHYRILRTILGP
jgi:hypothetical protein